MVLLSVQLSFLNQGQRRHFIWVLDYSLAVVLELRHFILVSIEYLADSFGLIFVTVGAKPVRREDRADVVASLTSVLIVHGGLCENIPLVTLFLLVLPECHSSTLECGFLLLPFEVFKVRLVMAEQGRKSIKVVFMLN